VVFDENKLWLVKPSLKVSIPKPSVDRFLLSLAEKHGEKSVGIILSGTGSDGAYGVRALREAGGLTIAQDSETAKDDGMPATAVQTGCVDLILPPDEIGKHLRKILTSPRDFTSYRQGAGAPSHIEQLLQILYARTRVDFSEYKQSTVSRRIERRMVALGLEDIEAYTQHCRETPQAVEELFKDLLISVTRFFRDRGEFEHLAKLLPELIEKCERKPMRVWVTGCATGEEAYSIAMLLCEALGGAKLNLSDHVQIYATDIDRDALTVARRGVYSASALNDVPKGLADKYFIREKDTIRVIDNLRNAILFSEHNVCNAPPFQRIDLLCCRNLLIYFGAALQRKVMTRFNYSMNDWSLLFLGTAENVSGSDEMFSQYGDALHIFRKRYMRRPELPIYARPSSAGLVPRTGSRPAPAPSISTDRQMFEALTKSLGEDSILVTDDYSIVRVYGNISPYIEVSADSNLKIHMDLLRRPLREEARTLITLALKNEDRRVGMRHRLNEGDDFDLRMTVQPIIAKELNERLSLVIFEQLPPEPPSTVVKGGTKGADKNASARIQYLEGELANTREALQQTIQELETSNEELQSLSEEMQSTNEELQATNEELETSNEELQSTHEELITVNEELQITAAELSGRTGELISVLETAPLAILVLDTALQVTQATNAATELFGLERPLMSLHVSQCAVPSNYPMLAPLCNEALREKSSLMREFTSNGSRVKLMCSPFFDARDQVKGVTMVVAEFPGLAQELDLLLSNTHILMMNRAKDGTILRISERSARVLGMSRTEAEGKNLYSIIDGEEGKVIQAQDLEVLRSSAKRGNHLSAIPTKETGGKIWLNAERFVFENPVLNESTIYSVAIDVTDVVDARQQAEEAAEQLVLLQNLAETGYWSLNLDTSDVYWSDEVYRIHGEDPRSFVPKLSTAMDFYHPEDRIKVQEHIENVSKDGGEFRFTHRLIRRDGRMMVVECIGLGKADDKGTIRRIIGVFKAL
jgi:two-component system CheB/CheR fusion protein